MPKVLWSSTFKDISVQLKLKLGFEHSRVIQEFQTFSLLLSHAFGGKNNKERPTANIMEAESQLNALFGR